MRISVIRIRHIELWGALLLAVICTVYPTVLQAQGARRSAQNENTTSSRHSEKFEGIFAFANGNGDGLLSAMKSDVPTSTEMKGLDSAVCDGGSLLQVAFVTHQGESPDSTGRYFPENFDRLEGNRFRVTRGKAPAGASCLVTQNQRISQEKLIPITRLRANVQFSAPDATGRQMHVSYQPCGQQTESELNRSRKGRRLRFCGEIARLGATMHLMVAEFERRGNDLLAAIALNTGNRLIVYDMPAKYDESNVSGWRVGDQGQLGMEDTPNIFTPLFAWHDAADGTIYLGLKWSGEEGQTLMLLRSSGSAFEKILGGYLYTAPL